MEALHAIATPKGGCAAGTRTRDAGLAPRRGGSRTHIAPASDCEPATRTPVLNIASGADPVEGRAQLSNGSRLSCLRANGGRPRNGATDGGGCGRDGQRVDGSGDRATWRSHWRWLSARLSSSAPHGRDGDRKRSRSGRGHVAAV